MTAHLIASCTLLALAYNVTDRAEQAVDVLERALVAVGERNGTLAVTERLGTIELEPLRDCRLALTLEAAIAIVGMLDDRTAPAALRRAEALRCRLRTLEDPPVYLLVMLAYYATHTNRASEARDLAERALRCRPYPPPLEICTLLIHTLGAIECYDALRRLCDELLALTRRRSARQETVAILVTRATVSCDLGALADAEMDARWALERADGRRRIHALTEVVLSCCARQCKRLRIHRHSSSSPAR
jgi:hypothetical protein